jgi:hypothetical protein
VRYVIALATMLFVSLPGTLAAADARVVTALSRGAPVYDGCLLPMFDDGWTCRIFGLRSEPDPWGWSTLYGYVLPVPAPGAKPIYRGCIRPFTDDMSQPICGAMGLRTTPDPLADSAPIGYAAPLRGKDAKPIYDACLTPVIQDERAHLVTGCRDRALRATADPWGFSSVLGDALGP